MDFSLIEVWVLRTATTILLVIALSQLVLHELLNLWTAVKRAKDIIVETNKGPVTISVNPESEESVRELLNVVKKADSERASNPNGEPT